MAAGRVGWPYGRMEGGGRSVGSRRVSDVSELLWTGEEKKGQEVKTN